VASTEGIDTLKSSSAQNVSTITMKLKLDADGDRALADVLSKVNEVKSVLPDESKDPVVKRTTGTPYALMYIGFNSKNMAPAQISDYLDRVVRPQIQAINARATPVVLLVPSGRLGTCVDRKHSGNLQDTDRRETRRNAAASNPLEEPECPNASSIVCLRM